MATLKTDTRTRVLTGVATLQQMISCSYLVWLKTQTKPEKRRRGLSIKKG